MNNQFDIRNHVEVDAQGRAVCPACVLSKGASYTKRNLSVASSGAYKCHRGCTPAEIREALGTPKNRVIPTAIAQSKPIESAPVTVSPQKVREANERLLKSDSPARKWLNDRGITDAMMARYQLGLVRSRCAGEMMNAISIPIHANNDGTAYYQKKRIAPWLKEPPPGYQPWSQKGIPARVFFTWKPAEAESTYLCEGEWDAILLGWHMRQAEQPIAVASFTAGCGTVPPEDQLNALPGKVYIFYDRNDKPRKDGTRPGDEGAKKVAAALGDRARIAEVPMPENCAIAGWDVSDALNGGFEIADFNTAAENAKSLEAEPIEKNPLWSRLQWNDDLLDTAPDHTEWLVPDLLTANELFLLASGPRMGKSLFSMTLTLAVAKGEPFLGRPTTQGTVLYVRMEDSPAKTKERETAQGWTRGLPVVWLDKFKLSELNHLRQIVEKLDPRLVVIDTLSRVKDSAVSESSAEMSQVLEPLQVMAQELDCCVLLVHHTGKVSVDNANNIDIFDTIRGSSAIRAVCRGSLILAAGERNFRLMAENGWGKHDLNILLDANTLQWKLLGNWNPTINGDQKEMVLEFLRHTEKATLEEIHDALGVPKASLYVVLNRLQGSSLANEKVKKEGKRRAYFYSLENKDAIEQLNTLLNSENPDSDSDRGGYLTKNDFFLRNGSIIDQVSQSLAHEADRSAIDVIDVKYEKMPPENNSNAYETGVSQNPRSMIDPLATSQPVKYAHKQGSKASVEGVSPIEQLFNKGDSETGSMLDSKGNSAYLTDIEQNQASDRTTGTPKPRSQRDRSNSTKNGSITKTFVEGDVYEVRSGSFFGKHVKVVKTHSDGLVEVKNDRWFITRKYSPSELRFVRRGEVNDS